MTHPNFYVNIAIKLAIFIRKISEFFLEVGPFLLREIGISSINHQNFSRLVFWKHKRLNGAENWLVYFR